jgi:lipoyl-dependent peroxiredoxin
MATTRVAHTNWTGGLTDGSGTVFFDSSGIGSYSVSWPARSEQPGGKTSPEELIAAALSSCYSMALSHELGQRHLVASTIDTQARVTFEPGTGITGIQLSVQTSLSTDGSTPASRTPNVPESRTPNVVVPQSRTPNEDAPDSRTPNDPDSRTPNDPDSRTPNEPDSRTPNEPNSRTPNATPPAALSTEEFQKMAELVKENCPVSQALAGVKITLDAVLLTN